MCTGCALKTEFQGKQESVYLGSSLVGGQRLGMVICIPQPSSWSPRPHSSLAQTPRKDLSSTKGWAPQRSELVPHTGLIGVSAILTII